PAEAGAHGPPGIAARGTRGLGLLSARLGPVAAMETFTPGSLEALNGTDVRLKCTFRSPVPAGPKLTVSWYFQSELKEPLVAVSPLAVRRGREAA
ncbi:Myelin protein zero-like protein 2, partial [Ophiophagus hannah]